MSEANAKKQTTSILELMYLIRAKNKGEMSFAEWVGQASQWAREVIAECETGQDGSAPSHTPTQSPQGRDEERSV
jgi:hypothetical protein